MKTLKITFLRQYKKLGKNQMLITVFTYVISGSEDQLKRYKGIQGDNFREDEESKKPLWFSTRFVGKQCDLIITSKDKVVADTSNFDQAASLASQYGGNLGQELARHSAMMLLGNPAPVAPSQPVAPIAQAGTGELGEM